MAKIRESGMPDEQVWAGFFKPEEILNKLGMTVECGDVAEFGSGYGTFSIPAARIIQGTLYGFDVEPEMINKCESNAKANNINNALFFLRDFVVEGTGLPRDSVDYIMLFNILHMEDPSCLLQEAWRILNSGGLVSVMHWNHDVSTPRGPSMGIRPHQADCRRWMEESNFFVEKGIIDLPPYHYGLIGRK